LLWYSTSWLSGGANKSGGAEADAQTFEEERFRFPNPRNNHFAGLIQIMQLKSIDTAGIPLKGSSPAHVAIIMDGNGRWAKARGLPRAAGHNRGVETLRHTISAAIELGITYLTVYAFSSENWGRPPTEIAGLMGLLRRYLRGEIAEFHKNGVRLRVIGERSRLPLDIVRLIEDAEASTAGNRQLTLVVALSYGGRQDIVAAVRRLAKAAAAGSLDPRAIDDKQFAVELFTGDIPDPDLVIRTSGEQRMSNFLLWQSANSELVFLDKYWPDFNKEDLAEAVHEFHRRDQSCVAALGSE
jgi:undecaprenyl diphosphate synthase